MPDISVIVPVYRVELYLRRCVDSVLAQTFQALELILVDDGSPDACPALCDEYARRDGRVRVLHRENGGLSAARNTGLDWIFANSESRWVFFLDSDDWLHPCALEALFRGAEETGLSVAVGGFTRTSGITPEVDAARLQAQCITPEELLCRDTVVSMIACGKLYRRECFAHIRYPVGKLHEDEFITYKILFALPQVAFIDQPLYAYYQNDEGIMQGRWSPGRLDAWGAMLEQTVYFRHHGFSKAYCQRIRALDYWCSSTIRRLRDENLQAYVPLLRRRMRKDLRKYRRELPIGRTTWGLYLRAYPILEIIYALLRKGGSPSDAAV